MSTLATVLDAALSDPRVTVGSLVIAGLSFAGLIGREWIRKAKHAKNNATQEKVSEDEVEALKAKAAADVKVAEAAAEAEVAAEDLRQVPGLVEKINKLWDEKDECKEALRGEREARTEDRRMCREETETLRAQLARMATTAAEAREKDRGEDTTVTRLRDLAAEVRRTPTPPEPMAAQPEERRGELVPRKPATEIPPPPRGPKETR